MLLWERERENEWSKESVNASMRVQSNDIPVLIQQNSGAKLVCNVPLNWKDATPTWKWTNWWILRKCDEELKGKKRTIRIFLQINKAITTTTTNLKHNGSA